MTTIRSFTRGDRLYRHVIDLSTDDVMLQVLECSKWQDVLRYDPHCYVWDVNKREIIGHFHIRDNRWIFSQSDAEPVSCEHTLGVDSLLESEVTISKRWVDREVSIA